MEEIGASTFTRVGHIRELSAQQGRHARLPSFLCVEPPSPSLSSNRPPHLRMIRKPASPRRIGATSTKRKQQDTAATAAEAVAASYYHYESPPAYIEPCLVQLCRLGKWKDVLDRCDLFRPDLDLRLVEVQRKDGRVDASLDNRFGRCHSMNSSAFSFEEIEPQQQPTEYMKIDSNVNNNSSDMSYDPRPQSGSIFRETALGIVCASKDTFATGEREKLVQTLATINPHQIGASQLLPGHTALRDAILNDLCSVKVLEILLEAHNRFCCDDLSVYCQKDSDGQTPLDHLIVSTQLGAPDWAVERLKIFVRMRGVHRRNQLSSSLSLPFSSFSIAETDSSPLIRLLAMGNSYEVHMSSLMRRSPRGGVGPTAGNPINRCSSMPTAKDNSRLLRICDVVQCLLDDDPSLLTKRSRMTGCLPIHIALRNYGNFEPLIRLLLDQDLPGTTMKVRNTYGDLPLHVACSVGVPLAVLRLVLCRTITASRSDSIESGASTASYNNLIWSTNISGFTPVDLEWVRNIESGNTLYAARTFYPLESTGVRKHCSQQDEFYRKLLNDTVSKFMQNQTSSPSSEMDADESHTATVDGQKGTQATFGGLLDRITLLIKAAATGRMMDGASPGKSTACLFDVCKLSTPSSPNLPLPLMELYLWLNLDDTVKDQTGKSPIHHALSNDKISNVSAITLSAVNDWKAFVLHLLENFPDQVRERSGSNRLPLHYALDNHEKASLWVEQDENPKIMSALQRARHEVVERLVSIFPEAVDQQDPVSGLYPHMMASMDPLLPLDTAFCLLRHSPSRCTEFPARTTATATYRSSESDPNHKALPVVSDSVP
mmetsp:Transcript_7255/g.17704  ORF Transcript_7255/g.17704 Transcript_7255/m.17704 type:complete len:829 (+) Transcript_7255:377-2863(+)